MRTSENDGCRTLGASNFVSGVSANQKILPEKRGFMDNFS
jgi:hypothetical protein